MGTLGSIPVNVQLESKTGKLELVEGTLFLQ